MSEYLKVVRGVVTGNGEVVSGTGFSIERKREGMYQVNFNPPFSDVPAITGTPANLIPDDPYKQNTKDNVVVPKLEKALAVVLTGDGDGTKKDRPFSFIAIGFR